MKIEPLRRISFRWSCLPRHLLLHTSRRTSRPLLPGSVVREAASKGREQDNKRVVTNFA